MAVVLALLASVTYGAADFLGGLMGRRLPITVVVLWSQAVSMVLALAAVVVFPAQQVTPSDIGWGAFAGATGTIGIYFLYQGLAQGRMAVVSPVAALVGAMLPMGVGIALGERPLPVEWIGIGIALPAIWLIAAVGDMQNLNGVLHGVMAGVGFGAFFAGIAQTGDGSGFWPLVGARVTQVAVLGFVAHRQGMGVPPPGTRLAVAAVGAGDMLANVFVLLAFRSGMLTLVAVLTSLYPAITVLLAVGILSEPIGLRQRLGLLLALLAVALIAL